MPPRTKPRAPLRPVQRIHALTGRTLAEVRPRRGETIARFYARARREGEMAALPTIVAERAGGELRPVLRQDWHRRIGACTNLVLLSQPLGGGAGGGGGSAGVAGIVGMVALMAIAGPLGTAAAGALFAGSGASAISALIVGGGSYLLSHFLGAKRGAKSAVPEYSVDIKSNMARSQQPIPVQYGRVKFFPDLAASSWSDYSGTDQVFHALYALGCGRYSVEEIGLGDTPIWTAAAGLRAGYADSVTLQFMDPGQACTLFPADVYSSPSVSGQTLPDPYGTTYSGGEVNTGSDGETSGVQLLGPFVANPAGSTTNHIAIDLIAPSGMYYTNSKGNTKPVSVDVRLEVQPIDDQGYVLGPWVKVIETPIIRESKQPVRLSLACDVAAGRYQVRLSRLKAMRQDGGVDTMTWVGLRSYLLGANTVPYASRLAVQMKADRLLSAASSQQLYVIATRLIPVYNGTGMALAASRNPVWAALDVWQNADYGGNLGYDKVDLPTLVALAADADNRGDAFNYRFTAQTTVLDAIETCLAVMLTKPVFLWDQFSMVRDQPRALPKLQLTDYEIVRGSLELNYTLQDTQTSDGTILEYVDEATWQQAEVTSRSEGVNLLQPTRVQTPGVTVRRQGTVVARYLAAVNNFRRKGAACEIEAEGRLLRRGDLVSIQSELPMSWGQASRVLDYDPATAAIKAESALDWSTGALFYVRLRKRDGTGYGPVLCGRGGDDATILLNTQDLARVAQTQGSWLDAVARGSLQDPASIEFSPGQPSAFMGLITAISQGSAENTFKIELVNDAPEVYTVDGQAVEPLPTPTSLVLPGAPANQLQHVDAYLIQQGTAIALHAAWDGDPGSTSYQAQLSYDNGNSFLYTIYTGAFPFFTVSDLSPNDCLLRIRGVNGAGLVGAWNVVSLTSPELNLSPASLGYGLGWDDLLPELYNAVQMRPLADLEALADTSIASLVGARIAQTTVEQSIAQARAKVEQIDYARATDSEALAGRVLTINASLADNAAGLIVQQQALVTLDKATASHFETLTATVAGNAADASRKIQVVADKASTTATDLTTLNTNFGNYSASVNQTLQTQSGINSSVSSQLTDIKAIANGAAASITDEKQARIDGDKASADSISSLSTTVGGHTSSISTLQSSQNGVLAQYGVVGSIDGQTGGFILTGARKNDGSVNYNLLIKANDVVIDGTLTASKIVDLSIPTGKIANGAISGFATASGDFPTDSAQGSPPNVSITLDYPANVFIAVYITCGNYTSGGGGTVSGIIYVDGNAVANEQIFSAGSTVINISAPLFRVVSLGAGQHTISVDKQTGGVATAKSAFISAQVFKK